MKFTIPSDEFMDNNYLLEEFSGVIAAIRKEKINDSMLSWGSNSQKKMSWKIKKLENIFKVIFSKNKLNETDEYTSIVPTYEYSFYGDKANFFPGKYYYLRFLKDRTSILVEKIPMILFCKFLSDYCEAFPEDLPLMVYLSISGNVARVTGDTTNEDLYIAFNKDPEETWKAVE